MLNRSRRNLLFIFGNRELIVYRRLRPICVRFEDGFYHQRKKKPGFWRGLFASAGVCLFLLRVASHVMRRPTRTRRLSIVAIVSLVVFVGLAGAGVRSYTTWDEWQFNIHHSVGIYHGYFYYWNTHLTLPPGITPKWTSGHSSGGQTTAEPLPYKSFLGFFYDREGGLDRYPAYPDDYQSSIYIPLWFPLLLLLILPVRWLIARRANAPASPVITDAKRA